MQFFKPLSILAIATQALAEVTRYQFFVKSDNKEIDGHGLYHIKEIDPVEYYFISNNNADTAASVVEYDDVQQEFFVEVKPGIKEFVRNVGDILQFRPGPPLKATIGDGGILSFTGSDSLFAKKDIHDPNDYSKNHFAVLSGGQGDGSPFTIEAREYAD